jgi:hypothetical protein
MFKGYDNLDPSKFFELNNLPMRGHSLKLVNQDANWTLGNFHLHIELLKYGIVWMI